MTHTKDLFLAAEQGRLDTFEDFPQDEEDINIYKDENENTLLFIATEKGNYELANLLIRKGADINAKNKYGKTPLVHAAENGDIDIVRLLSLLSTYGGIAEPDSYERAVSGAASNGYMHVLDLLLENINYSEAGKYVSTAIESAAQAKEISILSRLHERYHLYSNLGAAFSNALYLSALNGHVNLVEVLLETHDIDINHKSPAGRTALHAATGEENTKIAELLLGMDEIDISAQDENEWTALHLAAETNHTEIIKLLLTRDEIDTCINIKDIFGATALHLATEKGHSETVALLLAMDMLDINAQDNLRRTALHLAAGKGDAGMLELLLQGAQIDLNVRDQDEQTAFGIAVSLDYMNLVDLFLRSDGFDFDAAGVPSNKVVYLAAKLGYRSLMNSLLDKECAACPGSTFLSWCAENDQEEALKILLYDKGTDANSKDGNGRTPLSLSSQNGHVRVVETLLRHNADANLKDGNGRTPLSYSSENGYDYIVGMLLQHNADANLKDDNGRTPLSYSSENGYGYIVGMLLQHNADANLKDDNGRTPLSYSSKNGYSYRHIAEMLLRHNADANLKDDNGRTPLSYSSENGASEVAEVLLQHNANANLKDDNGRTPLSLSSENGKTEVVKVLLRHNVDANSKDGSGRTSLSRSAENGHEEVVRVLLHHKADPILQDSDARTPLWWAVKNGHMTCAKLLTPVDTGTLLLLTQEGNQDATEFLLSFKPKLDQRNHHGRTALHLAVLSGYLNIARSLIMWGAETSPRDNYSMTPLQLAMQRKDDKAIQLLLRNKASIKGIKAKEWREVYGKQGADIMLLSETPSGKQYIDFPNMFLHDQELSQTSAEFKSCLYVLSDDLNGAIWSKLPITVIQHHPVAKHFKITERIKDNILDISISLQLSGNRYSNNRSSSIDDVDDIKASRIMWRAIQPTNPGRPWTPLVYFSSLPYGWIPNNAMDLFEQFLTHIKTQWLELCDRFEEYLSDKRLEQLKSKGKGSTITDCLANDAQRLAELRTIIGDQASEAGRFINNYCTHYNANEVPETLQKLLKVDIEIGINKKIEDLDQTVRDLLQIEFAWITIHETRISTKLGQNVMLLTYVSIFYLPLGFCAALWAIPNITDNSIRTPFILTATVVSLVTLLITFNMDKIATVIQRGYQHGGNYIISKWEEMKGKQYPGLP